MKVVYFKGRDGNRIGIQTEGGILDFSAAFPVYRLVKREEVCPMITDILALIEKGSFTVDVFAGVLEFVKKNAQLKQ